uniref:Uncharacterized protein n=1 Tax=Arundo donax TaxID=35708 RepID=A0A0A9BQ32_ARUDO
MFPVPSRIRSFTQGRGCQGQEATPSPLKKGPRSNEVKHNPIRWR